MLIIKKNIWSGIIFFLAGLPVNEVLAGELALRNRSSYPLAYAAWNNGKNCTQKIINDPAKPNKLLVLQPGQTGVLNLPVGKVVAVGVAINEINDKIPLACDNILSFVLDQSYAYVLEFNVNDQRCYGQLYRNRDGAYQMTTSDDKEKLQERFPEFGWDQFEPGCVEQ